MYQLIASSSLKTLSESFCRSLTEMLPEDPLDPVTVIVPNRDLSRWLSMEIARQQGVMGNIRYLLPSEWFWQRARTLFSGLPQELPSDRGALKWTLFRILSEDQEREKLPTTLRSWIERQPERGQERLWDLSGVIASLFDQYQVYRPDLVNDWSRGILQGNRDEEKWQAFLWKRINDKCNTLDSNALKSHRGEIFEIIYQDIIANDPVDGLLMLFNPGLIPPPLVRLFMEHARYCQVQHYITCSFASVLGEEGSWPEWENPMLSSMAGEQVALITQLKKEAARSSQDIDWISLDRNNGNVSGNHPTLLGRVRHSIHTNRPMPERVAADGTIEVHSCHSTLREVETLYDYLLRQFEELEDLRVDQIAIVTPNPDRYKPWIDAVFSSPEPGLPRIPVYLPGGPGSRSGQLAGLFLDWLRLPGGRMNREELLSLLDNPVLSARFSLSLSDRSLLRRWFEEDRVEWGLDDEHRSEFGQPAGSRQTWEAALRRGWLGQLAAPESGQLLDGDLLFPGVSTLDEKGVWARFSRFVRYVKEWTEDVQKSRSPDEWAALLRGWAKRLFGEVTESEEEWLQIENSLETMVNEANWSMNQVEVPYFMVCSILEDSIDSFSTGVALYAETAVFHSMVPARGIPFRVIALLGLTDDQFPRTPDAPSFDLMKTDPRMGERDRRREDRNLFLESVMAAGEAHYCSYVGRSRHDDESLPPSVILDQWIDLVSSSCGLKRDQWVFQEPIGGFSSSLYQSDGPRGFSREYCKIAESIKKGGEPEGLSLSEPLAVPDGLSENQVSVHELEKFVSNPPRQVVRKQFGLRYFELPDNRREEFSVSGLERYLLFERILGWTFEGFTASGIRQILTSSGSVPESWLAVKTFEKQIQEAETAKKAAENFGIEVGMSRENVSFDLGGMIMHGSIISYSKRCSLDIHPAKVKGKRIAVSFIRHLLRSVLAEKNGEVEERMVLFLDGKGGAEWYRLNPVVGAGGYLSRFVSDYLDAIRSLTVIPVNSAWKYQKKRSGQEHPEPDIGLKEAHFSWIGNTFANTKGEREDRFAELILGFSAPLDVELTKRVAERWFEPVMEVMEKVEW